MPAQPDARAGTHQESAGRRDQLDETAPLLPVASGSSSVPGVRPPLGPQPRRSSTRTLGKKRSRTFGWLRKNSLATRRGNVIGNDENVDEEADLEDNVYETAFRTHSATGPDPTFREKLSFYLDTSQVGRWWEVFDVILNTLFCGLYIYISPYDDDKIPEREQLAGCVLAAVILLQWTPRCYLSLDPKFASSTTSIMTMLATVPVMIKYGIHITQVFSDERKVGLIKALQLWFVVFDLRIVLTAEPRNPFRFWRLYLVVLKIVKPNRNFLFNFSAATRKGISIFLSIFNLLLTVSAFVHIILRWQDSKEKKDFWDVFYWIFVTSSSGLSTGIVPDGYLSRCVIIFVMIAGIVFLPPALTEFIELIRTRSKYVHSYKPHSEGDHVVVVGDLEVTAVRDFLREFFCEDHGTVAMSTRVVMMYPAEPNEDLKALLGDPLYANRVLYIKGSTMSIHDLQKAKVKLCRSVFILSSNHTERNLNEVDAEAVMRAVSIKKFARDARLLVQVILPPNKLHFDYLAEHVFCLDEFKMGIISQNCIAPGFTTLINILVTSIPDASIRRFESKYDVKKGGMWAKEYVRGLTNEIYPVVLGRCFRGLTFKSLSERIYLRHGALLFALAAETEGDGAGTAETNTVIKDILVNPADYVLKGGEEAYMIARDAFTAETLVRDGEWMYEEGSLGDMEWERGWTFETLVGEDEEEEAGKGVVSRFTKAVMAGLTKKRKEKEKEKEVTEEAAGASEPQDVERAGTTSTADQKEAADTEQPAVGVTVTPPTTVKASGGSAAKVSAGLKVDLGADTRALSEGHASPMTDVTDEDQPQGRNELVFFGTKGKGLSAESLDNQPEMSLAPAPVAVDGEGNDALVSEPVTPTPLTPSVISGGITGVINMLATAAGSRLPQLATPPPQPVPTTKLPAEFATSPPKPAPVQLPSHTIVVSTPPLGPTNLPTPHLIICSLGQERFPSNLAYLVAPVRLREPKCGIVILSPADPDEAERARLLAYGMVWFIKGTALDRADLKRCGVDRCGKAVVLANASMSKDAAVERMTDAPALLAVLNLEALAKSDVFITVEFVHVANMKLMGSSDTFYTSMDVYGHAIMPSYASGHVFSQSMLNTLLVQTHYNPHLLVILKRLIFNTKGAAAPHRQSSTSSSSSVSTPHPGLGIQENGQLFKVKVSRRYYGQKWGLLVVRLIRDYNALCLALYRKEEVNGHEVSYIVVNPRQETRLRKGDACFLLAASEPKFS
ncbi:hypothetical protein HK101_007566 [Irineochytrium annulatum]|nr:hypothetical protein HK101_007566 [Irineochytrium annulatum]